MGHFCLSNTSPNHVIYTVGRVKLVINLHHHASLKPLFWPKCFSVENLIIVSLMNNAVQFLFHIYPPPPTPFPQNVYFLEVKAYRQEHYAGGRDLTYFDKFIYYPHAKRWGYRNGLPGRVAHSVTCLDIDASLTADPRVVSSIPAWSLTFVEIDRKITSMVILLPSAESFKKGCYQLQTKVCARSTC